MTKQLTIIFIFALSLVSVTLAKRGALGVDCDTFNYCEKGLTCIDYRCQIYIEGKPYTPVKWTPEGSKCDWFHHCESTKKCVKHRCKSIERQSKKQSSKLK